MFKLLTRLRTKELVLIAISVVFIVIQVWLDLKLPDYMANITTLVQTPGSSINDIWKEGQGMLMCVSCSLIASIIVGYLSSFIGAGFSKNLRKEMFEKVYSFGLEDVQKFSISSLITRTTNDVMHVQRLVTMGLQVSVKAPIMAVWAISKIINKSKVLSGLTGITAVVSMAIMFVTMIIVVPKFKKVQKLTDQINGTTREGLLGIRVVRAYNAEKYQEQKFDNVNQELTKLGKFTGRTMSALWPCIDLTTYALTLGTYIIGAFLIQNALLDMRLELFSNIIVFSNYSSQVLSSFMMLSMIVIMYPRVSVSANRILDVLQTNPAITDGPITTDTEIKGTIEFKNVSFKYPDMNSYILQNISFTAAAGETIAIVGATGSGKTTLVNLIPRFYDVSNGEILIDGINIKEYSRNALNSKISYVPQKAMLFSGTVHENVAYGESYGIKPSEQDVIEAISVAQAEDFVLNMDGQYNAKIARGGNNISGGQKQRLQIARAIARNPEFYIFDDSFSALDYKTDAALRKAIKEKASNSTKFIVAQRISTIRYADKIIVIDKGTIVGMGKHNELLDSCSEYRSIAEAQLRKEELYNG